ncbi:hypothetical protein [Vulcanisaeta distributa]|uniref:hypothetical protein n=1 Tax=Vulcanisaeta distributa TaxID=164451 RepID=UPI000AFDDDE9|nr:hypothetical protein [Vulcanisaeta distributa]
MRGGAVGGAWDHEHRDSDGAGGGVVPRLVMGGLEIQRTNRGNDGREGRKGGGGQCLS